MRLSQRCGHCGTCHFDATLFQILLYQIKVHLRVQVQAHLQANLRGAGLNQRMQAFATVFNAGDAESLSSFYTVKGALLPPRSKALIGRATIAAHYAQAFKGGVGNLTLKVLEVEMAGSATAVEIGQTKVKLGAKTILGRYLHVWEKTDGVWLINRDIYHVLGVSK